jgi:hypothetical protein
MYNSNSRYGYPKMRPGAYVKYGGRPIQRPAKRTFYKAKPFTPNKSLTLPKKKFGATHINVVTNGINSGFSQWTLPKNTFMEGMSKKYFVGAKNKLQQITPVAIGVATSTQASQNFGIFTVADMTACLAAINEGPSDTLGETVNTARSYFEKMDATLTCTNSSNGQVLQDIYVFKCRNSCNVTPNQIWSAAMKDESGQTGTDYTGFWGVIPSDCPAINEYWETKAVYHTTMQPGQTHIQRFNHHFCLPINNSLLDTEYVSDAYIHGKSYAIMVIIKGMPETASTASFIATTACKVDYVYDQKYYYKYIADNTTNFNYAIKNGGFGTAATIYNQGSGASSTAAGI